MAWVSKLTGKFKKTMAFAKETKITLPSSATTEYSSEIDFLKPNLKNNNYYVTFGANASAVSGTNIDIALYGADVSGGTKYLLKDALVADITATGRVSAVVDLNQYPAPYYYIAHTSDVDESANTIDYFITFPKVE